MKIAIIDDMITKHYLQYPNRLVKIEWKITKKYHLEPNRITHATICAAILEKCVESYELYNIVVIDENRNGTIENLISALEYCLINSVEFICLSIGTTKLSEVLKLQKIISEVSKNSIIIAAYSNSGYLTLPAILPEVIGVAAIPTENSEIENVVSVSENELGIDILASYNDIRNHAQQGFWGNSLIVPFVLSEIINKLNTSERSITKVNKEYIKALFPLIDNELFIEIKNKISNVTDEVIYVQINESSDYDINYYIEAINLLNEKFGVEAMLCTSKYMNDVRCLNGKKYWKSNGVNRVYGYVDIVFLLDECVQGCIDYIVEMKSGKVVFWDADGFLIQETDRMHFVETLVSVLDF